LYYLFWAEFGERENSEWGKQRLVRCVKWGLRIAIQSENWSGGKKGSFGKQERIYLELFEAKTPGKGS